MFSQEKIDLRLLRLKIIRLDPERVRNGCPGLLVVRVVPGFPGAADQRQCKVVISLITVRLLLQDLLRAFDAGLDRGGRIALASTGSPRNRDSKKERDYQSLHFVLPSHPKVDWPWGFPQCG